MKLAAMSKAPAVLLLLACLYSWLFSTAYASYLAPVFGYAGFNLLPRSDWQVFLTYLLAAAPVLACPKHESPGKVLAATIYATYYVPAQFCVLYAVQGFYSSVLALQVALFFSMVVIFVASYSSDPSGEQPLGENHRRWVAGITVAMVAVVAFAYRSNMRLVSFADVYELRFENINLVSPIIGYLVMWLSYCFLPYILAEALVYRRALYLIVGIVGCVVIYAGTGAKSAILTPAISLAFYFALRGRGNILFSLLLGISAFVGLLLMLPNDGIMTLIKTLVFERTLGTPGWALSTYYNYFSQHGYTYLSHIRLINALSHTYPYGSLQLGQVIGVEISGTDLANFNAGFWASEGVASFGTIGIYLITIPVALFLLAMNWLSRGYDTRWVGLWCSGFAVAAANLPFPTTLLSGGGLWILAILFFSRWHPKPILPQSRALAGSA